LTNLGLHFLGEWLFRLVVPGSIALALLSASGGPVFSPVARIGVIGGPWAVFAASCLLLDLAGYLVHRLEHAMFPLWRLHSVHHADIDVDATTAVRHHPFEIILMGIAILVSVVILGVPLWAWAAYSPLVLMSQLAQHANVRLPARLDATLGLLLMTPGLHRTHHASTPEHFNCNFGEVLTVWDRCFQTLAPPLPEQNPPSFGVAPYQTSRFAEAADEACRKRRRFPANTSRKSMQEADPLAQYVHLDILNKALRIFDLGAFPMRWSERIALSFRYFTRRSFPIGRRLVSSLQLDG
jgi:sterol desaturase/sphingolipid hydroxylase (fatty acid hydroxylase superfamily)